MRDFISKNVQTNTRTAYAGSNELWSGEKLLVNYNNDLIRMLVGDQKQASDVLEFGAGIGTLATLWETSTGVKPECLEIDVEQRKVIEQRGFRCYENLQSITKQYDLVYTSNVLEHIEDDQLALSQLYLRIKDRGSLVVYVPAFQLLYSKLDEKIGHYRRYEKKDLLAKLAASGFMVSKFQYCDSIGFFAWLFLRMRGATSESHNNRSMAIYDRYVFPFSKVIDNMGCKWIFGKNILVYARKTIT